MTHWAQLGSNIPLGNKGKQVCSPPVALSVDLITTHTVYVYTFKIGIDILAMKCHALLSKCQFIKTRNKLLLIKQDTWHRIENCNQCFF